jgi:hypothetical protein
MGRAGQRLKLFARFPQMQACQRLPGSECLQNFLKGSIPMGFEASQEMSQAVANLPDLGPDLQEGEG